jgi:hypothetical protein
MNAVKHGLLAEELLITIGELTEDPEAFGQLLTGLREHCKPVGTLEDTLVQKISAYLWKERRAQRFETGAIQREVVYRRGVETVRNNGRLQQAFDSGENLEESSQGIQHLLIGLDTAIEQVQQLDWPIDSYSFIVAHFGHLVSLPPAAATTSDGQAKLAWPDEFDPNQLLKELKAQRDRLRERRPAVEAAETRAGDARVRTYSLPNANDPDLLLRYDTANDRKLHRAIRQLRQVQADRLGVEAAAGATGGDQPAAP